MLLTTAIAVAMISACGGGGDVEERQTIAGLGTPTSGQQTVGASPELTPDTANIPETRIGAFLFDEATPASSEDPTESVAEPMPPADPAVDSRRNTFAERGAGEGASRVVAATGSLSELRASLELTGNGVRDRIAPRCTPQTYGDFIDLGTWDKRRLLPRDCLSLETNPPHFSWPQPDDRDVGQPWTLTLRRSISQATYAVHTSNTPRLALNQALPLGEYEWIVSYVAKSGQRVTSQPRRFTVPRDAKQVEFPDGAALAAVTVLKSRPRVLPAGATFAGISSVALAGELAPMYQAVIAAADAALRAPIPAPSQAAGNSALARSLKTKTSSDALRKSLDQERRFVEALGFAARLTGDQRYRDAGIARVMALAEWSPDGETSEAAFDYANRAIYLSLSQALDLYSGWLSATQTAAIVGPLRSRLGQAIARFGQLDTNPYDSHVDIIVWSVLEALLYSVGTNGFDQARPWLANTWDLLLTTANTWGADEGGFGNGVAYAWYRMDHIGQTLAAVRVITGVNLAKHGSIARLGDHIVAFTSPRGTHRGAFGDGTEVTTHYANYAYNQFRLYALLTGDPVHNWYWQMDANPFRKGRYFSPWHLMLPAAGLPPPTPAAPTQRSWAFDDAGVTAIHTDASAPDRSSVFFRSSEFGSWVHSHANQNSFALVSRGKDLLISGGYYPYFLSPHHATVTRATRFGNTLTFDGGIGQAEESTTTPKVPGKPRQSRDARGQLINHGDNGTWAASSGDATLAYRSFNTTTRIWSPLLTTALRSVAYNRQERVLVVYDYATSAQARTWELNFNTLNAVALDGTTARVSNQGASACIDVHAAPTGGFNLSQGFPVAPENGAPDQYQARYVSQARSLKLVSVTVIREDCRELPISVAITGDAQASVAINGGMPVLFDKRRVTLP